MKDESSKGLLCDSGGKASAYNVGDLGLIPGSGRSPGEGNGNPHCRQMLYRLNHQGS